MTARVFEPTDTVPANDAASATLPFGEVVDLSADVDLTPDATPLRAGGSVGVSAKVANEGGRDATGVVAVATWDDSLVASVAHPPDATLGAGRLEWPVSASGVLPAGDPGRVVSFSLALRPELPATSNPLRVDLALISDPTANPEVDLADNRAAASVTAVAEADACVTVEAVAEPARAVPGGALHYDVRVENRGSTAASAVALTLHTDPWLGAATDAGGGVPSAGTTTWSLGALPPGGSAARRASFLIPSFLAAERSRSVAASASVSAPEDAPSGCAPDSAPVITNVTLDADLAVDLALRGMTERDPAPPARSPPAKSTIDGS